MKRIIHPIILYGSVVCFSSFCGIIIQSYVMKPKTETIETLKSNMSEQSVKYNTQLQLAQNKLSDLNKRLVQITYLYAQRKRTIRIARGVLDEKFNVDKKFIELMQKHETLQYTYKKLLQKLKYKRRRKK